MEDVINVYSYTEKNPVLKSTESYFSINDTTKVLRNCHLDDDSLSSTCSVTVTILDMNDNQPEMPPDYTKKIIETAETQTVVLTVFATDTDNGCNGTEGIHYAFGKVTNGSQLFSINNKSGIIKVDALLRDHTGLFYLDVVASDSGIPPRNTSTAVFITIKDENNNKPVFHFRTPKPVYSIYEVSTLSLFSFSFPIQFPAKKFRQNIILVKKSLSLCLRFDIFILILTQSAIVIG